MTTHFVNHALSALERSPASAATVDKPYITSHDKNDALHVGLGTAEAGSLPIVRYWTVKIEAHGRIYYVHVEACDAWKATMVAMKRNSAAISAQVVREIDREEFEEQQEEGATMSHTVIRFPTAARFERPPMATRLTLRDRLKRWLFGYARPVNLASLRIERARNGR